MVKQNKTAPLFLVGCKISFFSLLLLILAGGIVRSSGSGMGCPDWPKCFNRMVPPTSVNELPRDYEEKFLAGRLKKNTRLAGVLTRLGFADLAGKVLTDPEIRKAENFNAFKTWAEYINRLIGVLTGIFFIALFLVSLSYRKTKKWVTVITGLNLILIFFQAYLGSLVVSTNLLSGLISVHMLLAILILFLLLWSYNLALNRNKAENPAGTTSPYSQSLLALLVFALVISMIQILLGTSVRSSFDSHTGLVLSNLNFEWAAGSIFPLHRLVSLLVFSVNGYIVYFIYKRFYTYKTLRMQVYYSFLCIVGQMVLGLTLEIGHLPPVSQALHVFLAVLLFSSQVWEIFLLDSLKPANLVIGEI